MRVLKTTMTVGVLSLLMATGTAFAQAAPEQTPPKPAPTTPPAGTTQTPQMPPATPAPQPPAPFPEGAKIAYIDVQAIASTSAEGKGATAKLDELKKKKTAELADKQKRVQELQTKLQQGSSVMSDQARSQLEREIEKTNREIQFFQEDAQREIQELYNQLMNDFQTKLNPILEQVATEKGLHMMFDQQQSGAVWGAPGLNLTAEVIKRFDAAAKAPAKK